MRREANTRCQAWTRSCGRASHRFPASHRKDLRSTWKPSRAATGKCERPEAFVTVAGDVSLDYALSFIARTKPAFADDAKRYLKRLAGSGVVR